MKFLEKYRQGLVVEECDICGLVFLLSVCGPPVVVLEEEIFIPQDLHLIGFFCLGTASQHTRYETTRVMFYKSRVKMSPVVAAIFLRKKV